MIATRPALLFMLVVAIAACGGGTTAPSTTTAAAPTTTSAPPAPAYVPPECATTPMTMVTANGSTTTSPAPEPLAPQQQFDVIAAIDTTVRDHYLYPDFNGTDWDTAVSSLESDVTTGLDTAAFYESVDGLITSLGDEHSHFESPQEVAETEAELGAANEFVGIGSMLLPVPDKGVVTVMAVFPGSAADHAGLQVHDSILAVDGILLTDPNAYRNVRGPECSLVVLEVRRPGETARVLSAIRYRVEGGIPISSHLVPTDDGRSIGYILIPTLTDGSIDDQVRSVLEEFGALDGLILDLRVNGGGSSLVLEPLLALFTSGTLGDFESREGTRPLEIAADGVSNSQDVPLVVLIGDDTESYGEVLAGPWPPSVAPPSSVRRRRET